MSNHCEQHRESWEGAMGDRAELSSEFSRHLEDCSSCRARWARHERLVGVLGTLSKLETPSELEGRVAASFGAGARQDRVVRELGSLAPVAAPAALEAVVGSVLESDSRGGAPEDLKERVAEELEVPGSGRVRSHLGNLRREEAPEVLRLRVERELRLTHGPRIRSVAPIQWLRPRRLISGIAAAVVLLLAGRAWLSTPGKGTEGPDSGTDVARRELSFQLVRVDSPNSLSPMAGRLFRGVQGLTIQSMERAEPDSSPVERER